MPGAWEFGVRHRVLVGILHTETVPIAWAFGLRNLIVPGDIMPVAGMPYQHARNEVCKFALGNGYDYVGFLDSDVIPPRDAFVRLMAHNKPFISGLYSRRSPPHSVPVMIRNGQWVQDYRPGEVVEVDLVGAGLLVIHRDALVELAKNPYDAARPWFDWRVDMRGLAPPETCLSEDFTLCHRARTQLGMKILVDTSIVAKHVGLAEATHGNFKPCEVSVLT